MELMTRYTLNNSTLTLAGLGYHEAFERKQAVRDVLQEAIERALKEPETNARLRRAARVDEDSEISVNLNIQPLSS